MLERVEHACFGKTEDLAEYLERRNLTEAAQECVRLTGISRDPALLGALRQIKDSLTDGHFGAALASLDGVRFTPRIGEVVKAYDAAMKEPQNVSR